MSGLEASAAVFGFIAGAIDITHKAIEIYSAVEDKSGIPTALRKVSEKLPSIEGILRNAEAQCKGVKFDKFDKCTLRDMKRDVEECKDLCQELHDLLLSAYPKAGSGKAGRLLKGTKTVFSKKGKTAEGLLQEIREYLALLAKRQIISNAALLEDIKSLVEDLPKEGRSTQQQSALLPSGHKDHKPLSADSSDNLQSWILSSQGRTSSLALSTKLQPGLNGSQLADWASKSCAKYSLCNRSKRPHQVRAYLQKDIQLRPESHLSASISAESCEYKQMAGSSRRLPIMAA